MFPRSFYPGRHFAPLYFPSGVVELTHDPALEVVRGYEGPQLVLRWTPPNPAFVLKIVRKLGGYPESVDDGVVVVTDTAPFSVTSYSDRDVEPLFVYYYAMFVGELVPVSRAGYFPHSYFPSGYFCGSYFPPAVTTVTEYATNEAMRGKEFAVETGFFENRMWGLLPNTYHRADGEE